MEIEKINGNNYRVIDSSELESTINNLVDSLSLGTTSEFETILTDQLKDTMASRLVAAHFNKLYPTVFSDSNMYVIIKASIGNREINISVGKLTLDDKTRTLNGVLYK